MLNNNHPHIIIFSHGFGVRKDDNGLFLDIARDLPECQPVMFDYYQVDEVANTITVCSASEQVHKLKETIARVRAEYPEATIDLIGHSRGTVAIALAKPLGIRKIILLAPVLNSWEHSLRRYQARPDAIIDLDGISVVPSTKGLTKIIPAVYWQESRTIDPVAAFNGLAGNYEVTMLIANNDVLQPPIRLNELDSKIKLEFLDGGHDFSGENRPGLISRIREILL